MFMQSAWKREHVPTPVNSNGKPLVGQNRALAARAFGALSPEQKSQYQSQAEEINKDKAVRAESSEEPEGAHTHAPL